MVKARNISRSERNNENCFGSINNTGDIAIEIHNRILCISGDATVLWKQGERVIFADKVHIGREVRASIIDETSLLLRGVDTQYTGT